MMRRTASSHRRLLISLSVVSCLSIVLQPVSGWLLDAASPRYSPEQFNLPATAREVLSKRTENTATFEITPGKFAQVSGFDGVVPPPCPSWICSVTMHLSNLLPEVIAASIGPNSAGAGANVDKGANDWSTPGNVTQSDNQYAATTGFTDYLQATQFGFSIPDTANVDGIVVEIEKSNFSGDAFDEDVKLVIGGVISGDDKAKPVSVRWPTSDEYVSYGGVADTWGLTVAPSDINATNFGMVISAGTPDAVNNVDHIRITVYYTEAAAEAVPFFSPWSLPLLLIGILWVMKREGLLSLHQ